MSKEIVLAGRVLTQEGVIESGVVQIADGVIHSVGERAAWSGNVDVDYGDNLIAPGFIDIHVHGAVGHRFIGSSDADGIVEALRYHFRHGTTGILPTSSTDSDERIKQGLSNISEMIGRQKKDAATGQSGRLGSEILGVHIEGPYLNAKQAGAQNKEWLRAANLQEYQGWEALAPIRMITIAPEMEGSEPVIRYIRERGGVLISAGHTDATYDEMVAAEAWGVSHCTHFGNGMRGLHHREPGTFGAGLIREGITVELIADGIHVHPQVLELVYRVKGAASTALITDAVTYCGMKDGVYPKGAHDKRQVIVENGAIRLKDTGGLAGSCLTMNRAAKMMFELGAPITDVWEMASAVPARLIGLDARKGRIKPGMDADLIVLDRDFNVRMTMNRGVAHEWTI